VSLSLQELKYPVIASTVKVQIFLTALNMGLAPVDSVSVQRYGTFMLIHFFIS
jgi:hypothetical protein